MKELNLMKFMRVLIVNFFLLVYLNIDGMLYYIKGLHLREFGFPRQREDDNSQKKKSFKWKKTNFVTDVPKHSPISKYLVAKSKFSHGEYFMHAAVLS